VTNDSHFLICKIAVADLLPSFACAVAVVAAAAAVVVVDEYDGDGGDDDDDCVTYAIDDILAVYFECCSFFWEPQAALSLKCLMCAVEHNIDFVAQLVMHSDYYCTNSTKSSCSMSLTTDSIGTHHTAMLHCSK
jgi:hypothetical protein